MRGIVHGNGESDISDGYTRVDILYSEMREFYGIYSTLLTEGA